MAIAFVNRSAGGNTSSTNSIATTAQSLTTGNHTVVSFWVDNGSAPSGVPTDTAGNTYVQVGTTQETKLSQYQAFNCIGNASNVVTLPLSASSDYRAWSRLQFSGLPAADPYLPPFKFGSGAGTGDGAMFTAAVGHGAGEAVIVAFGVCFASGGIVSGGSGYTFNAFLITGYGDPAFADEYKIVTADDTPTMTAGGIFAWRLFASAFGVRAPVSRSASVGQAVKRASSY